MNIPACHTRVPTAMKFAGLTNNIKRDKGGVFPYVSYKSMSP
jgi:hypothetical protein